MLDLQYVAQPAGFSLCHWRDGGDARIELHGELDLQTVSELEAALAEAEASDAEAVLLDLRRLRFMDVTALGALLDVNDRLTDGRALLLLRGKGPVRRLFETAGVEQSLFFLD